MAYLSSAKVHQTIPDRTNKMEKYIYNNKTLPAGVKWNI